MKRKLMLALALMMIAAVAFLTTSCAKQTTQSQTETTSQPEVPVASEEPAEPPQPAEVQAEEPAPPFVTEVAIVTEKIYFGFDSAALSDQATPILTQMADNMHTNPGLSVTVQGHCDERGTDAYNIALGKRRADSVKNHLVSLGIPAERVDTKSYGKFRPIATGHNEEAWTRNRRVEFEIN